MTMLRTRTTAVTTALLIAAMSLAGCSSGSSEASPSPEQTSASPKESPTDDGAGSGEQTTAEACTQLQESIEGVQEDLTSSLGELQTDPAAAAAAITELSDSFAAGVDELQNEEVRAAAEPAGEALASLATALQTYSADPAGADPSTVTSSASGLQASFTELAQVCS